MTENFCNSKQVTRTVYMNQKLFYGNIISINDWKWGQMMNQVTGRHIHDMIARQGGERIFEIEKDTIFKDKT